MTIYKQNFARQTIYSAQTPQGLCTYYVCCCCCIQILSAKCFCICLVSNWQKILPWNRLIQSDNSSWRHVRWYCRWGIVICYLYPFFLHLHRDICVQALGFLASTHWAWMKAYDLPSLCYRVFFCRVLDKWILCSSWIWE